VNKLLTARPMTALLVLLALASAWVLGGAPLWQGF
jgi:hypothetical protein